MTRRNFLKGSLSAITLLTLAACSSEESGGNKMTIVPDGYYEYNIGGGFRDTTNGVNNYVIETLTQLGAQDISTDGFDVWAKSNIETNEKLVDLFCEKYDLTQEYPVPYAPDRYSPTAIINMIRLESYIDTGTSKQTHVKLYKPAEYYTN